MTKLILQRRWSILRYTHDRIELISAISILAIVLALETNAALHGGSQGQDFYQHQRITVEVANNPIKWILETRRRVDPPGFYLISAAIFRLTGPLHWATAMGIFGAAFNTLALLVLYLISRLLIQASILRICALCLAGFLPAFVIPSVVIAADALCQLPCLLMVYFAGLVFLRRIRLRKALIVAILAAVFCIGCKFIGVALIPAFVATMFFAALSKRLSLRQCALATLLFLGVTVPFQTTLVLQSFKGVAEPFVGTEVNRQMHLRKLQVRSVLFFRSGDLELFDVPSHWQMALNPKTHPPSFWNSNRYSYPALLCLGTFTDILDFFQSKANLDRKPKEAYKGGALVGKRSNFNHTLMKISVCTGFAIFMTVTVSLPFLAAHSFVHLLRHRSERDLIWLSAFLLGAGWLSFIICLLPLVIGAYLGGYYLPRLIVPSILIAVLLFFAGLDRISFFRRQFVALSVLCLVIAQSLLHFTFLWIRN
jgi:4-amino-4-deoxy-L-arabinose transferase and related glycosyltransferases of PMT family